MEFTPYLTNVVIVDLMRVDLFPQSCTTHIFVASNGVQAKERNYHDQHLIDQFLPLAIAIFGCSYMIVPMPFGVSKG
jgi:hypothetical protein